MLCCVSCKLNPVERERIYAASECPENTRYPNKPNGITDPFYSIQCGVRYLKKCMEEAGVKDKDDIKKLQLAAQGYNFGNGYISWAKLRGGYSYENALEFSRMQADSHGWNSYGDPMYGLKFYNVYTSTSSADAGNLNYLSYERSYDDFCRIWSV